MTTPVTRFPYEVRTSHLFGTIRRPIAHVQIYSAALQRWLAYTMVVDTGADYCVLPASVALDLGIPLQTCERQIVSGVGGRQQIFLYRALQIRLGSWIGTLPVGFVEHEDVPPLLGRYQWLDVFDMRFCNFVTTFSTRVRSVTPR